MHHHAAQAENLRVAVHRNLDVPVFVAFLMRGDEILAAVLNPFHWPAKRLRRDRDARIFRIKDALRSETATNVGRNNPQLVIVQIERIQELPFHAMRTLRRNINRETVRHRIMRRNKSAAFHEKRATTMGFQIFAKDMSGFAKRIVIVAVAEGHARRNVRRRSGMNHGRGRGDRRQAIGSGRKHLVIHIDKIGRVFRDIAGIRDHHCDWLADIADLILCQRIRHEQLGDRRIGYKQREWLLHRRRQIGVSENKMHTGDRTRSRSIDTPEFCMCMRAADKAGVKRAGQTQIIDEMTLAPEQRRVLDTLHRRAEKSGPVGANSTLIILPCRHP